MSVAKEKLERKFAEEYEKLNERQRLAVDTIEGPVMVIAGPGTGKTQILASRIGKILLETDSLPENILCLTYTDAGVVAMRKRLLQFIGPDAYKVNLYTFHAFCNDVIQENLSLFEKTALDPISDLERIELFKHVIDNLPKNHPLKRYRGDVYFEITNLQQLFSNMKKEGWTPAYIHQKIDEYIADLPLRDAYIAKKASGPFKKGDVRTDRIEAEVEKMNKLRAAVDLFEPFQQLMRQRNRYDFDDMINWVINAFSENKQLLARYQEQYLYILVDEYQDTSGTQNRIVELLINYWEHPNVFVVGDDDQSIFRFQGANVENMLQFANGFSSDLLTVILTRNYRSTQPILDVSRTLINRNEERLVKKMNGLTKELVTSRETLLGIKHPPRFKCYETMRQEMIGIALDIQQLTRAGVSPGKMAVIYKENKYGEELTRYLQLLQIPVYSKRNLNVLELPLAVKVLQLLRFLAAEHDTPYGGDELLFELLHFSWWNIPPIEIAKVTVQAAEARSSDGRMSLRRLLAEKSKEQPKDLFTPVLPESLLRASRILEELLAGVPNLTLQHLLENTIRQTGLLQEVLQSPDKHRQLQVLTALFDFVKEETHRNPTLRLEEFINMIELMEREKISLPLVQVSGSDKGVNLLTAHGSKGLEFEYVFFAGCNAGFWEKKRKPGGGYALPDTMFDQQPKHSDEEELRRLFYVALTRAEQHLHLSWSRFKNDGKELEPSMFIAEIQEEHNLQTETIILSDEALGAFAALQFGEAAAPEMEQPEEDFINTLLEKFTMNVTALNNYLDCPLGFYYKNLIRIPSPKNEATEFGSAIHYALEQLFRNMQDSGTDTFPGKEAFIEKFMWYMKRHRESFTREQFKRRMEYGQEVLSNYYDASIGSFNKIVAIERRIKTVYKNIPIRGAMDKLEFDGKNVNVVDYKTGDVEKAKDKLKGPDEKQPNGGDYWRQAVFYKLLIDHYDQKDWRVVSTEFDFVEPDKKKQYRKEKIVITPADLETVSQQITSVWEKIQNREFYTGCGKEDCHWCNFVKNNNLAIALHELPDEE